MSGKGDYEEIVGLAVSALSKNNNEISDLKTSQARIEQKFDDHMVSTEEKLAKILGAVEYTNGKVKGLELWKETYIAEQKGIEKGKAIASGKEPRFSSTQVKVALVTAFTSIAIAVIAVWEHYITRGAK